ncbi:DUF4468 domain-containing protein [Mucilaginibacter flavidus]|uniref:DUF4468 domain-containing protein n=1 Tax=Mucilaginibacter flavidus TaxID=2949309 RepID=UPI0020922448|nr:DUF4468 domain-containing protein [Mucilaginibacter flavidus]MCO5948156.1 DUF4468 domain-containing protein [Mucilaginibacter flavidus]
MKKLTAVLVFVLFAGAAFAQKDSLAFDENNKYIYYQVVQQPGTIKDTLFNRAQYFFKKADPATALSLLSMHEEEDSRTKEKSFALMGSGKFLVSKKTLLTSHEDGSVSFTLRIDIRDGKYRYWLTDFVFNPYQRNRYNVYESIPGIYIPLEKPEGKIEKKDLAAYLNGVLTSSLKIGEKLKEYMTKVSAIKKDIGVKKISTKDW